MGTPPGGRGYVATLPTCGPPVILSPALKRRGPPRQQGLCSHLAHLWATSDFAPRFEAVGTPPGSRGYVATLPTSGPPVILSPALKRWGSPRRQGLCSHLAHLWATCDCSLAYHRLRLNIAATPTAMNPSTNLPVRCKVLDCRKWHCTYAMPHHMAQAHPGVSHDYAGCSEEEKTKVLQAFDNFRAPLPPKAKPAAPPALPIVLPTLLFRPN